jgi:hypothetical protein
LRGGREGKEEKRDDECLGLHSGQLCVAGCGSRRRVNFRIGRKAGAICVGPKFRGFKEDELRYD